MRVLKKDLRGDEGEIALLPETLDDLWHLRHLVERGDLVFALTHRKVAAIADKARPEKMERKTVRLGIQVEDIEFHIYSNWLRLHGVINIRHGCGLLPHPEYRGRHRSLHTQISLEAGPAAAHRGCRGRVAAATRWCWRWWRRARPPSAFCASLGCRWPQSCGPAAARAGARIIGPIFFRDVAAAINQAAGEGAQVILAGPGFAKEDLKKVIDATYADLAAADHHG